MRLRSSASIRLLFAAACAAAIGVEAYLLFWKDGSVFGIEGRRAYDIAAFAAGQPVAHAFLMRGEGLRAVSVHFESTAPTTTRVKWTLWRGYPDDPVNMTRAFEHVEVLDLRPGSQWKTFVFTRDGSSKDRWYTIEVQLVDSPPPPAPQVSLVASSDNPDRGGVLFVNAVRQPGSLNIRAARTGRTLYRRFLMEAAPRLPVVLRRPVTQWALALLFHWAVIVFAWSTVSGAAGRSAVGQA